MVDSYSLITVTHKQLNTEDLDGFVLRYDNDEELQTKLNSIKTSFNQSEVVYLATCNRVMFLFYGKRQMTSKDAHQMMYQVNPTLKQKEHQNLDNVIVTIHGLKAIEHLLEVCASIDSLVVGEREIFRQFRQAYNKCNELNLCDDYMRILEKSVVAASKEVYTKTEIGAKAVSVVSLTIQEFLKRNLNKSARVLLIGAGDTNAAAGRLLRKHGYEELVIFNRSLDNAVTLSKELNAEAFHLNDLKTYDEDFDCIIASTSSQEPIVDVDMFTRLSKGNFSKLVIDLSIPNNVGLSNEQLEHTDYINIDSIRSLAAENLKARSGNITAARIILSGHLSDFHSIYEKRRVERVFKDLPSAIANVKDRALHNVYKDKIDELPESSKELIYEIASYMQKKCVAVPIKLAKEVVG